MRAVLECEKSGTTCRHRRPGGQDGYVEEARAPGQDPNADPQGSRLNKQHISPGTLGGSRRVVSRHQSRKVNKGQVNYSTEPRDPFAIHLNS